MVIAGALAAAPANAGDLYGRVRAQDGAPVANAAVKLQFTDGQLLEGSTDEEGIYRVRCPRTGPATLSVVLGEHSSESLSAYAYIEPRRWNLMLGSESNGMRSLRRE